MGNQLSASESDFHIPERSHSHRRDSHKLGVLMTKVRYTVTNEYVGSCRVVCADLYSLEVKVLLSFSGTVEGR